MQRAILTKVLYKDRETQSPRALKLSFVAVGLFNASLLTTWEIKTYFLSPIINLVMEVKCGVMVFHVCLQSRLGTGQGRATLAHNMEKPLKKIIIKSLV